MNILITGGAGYVGTQLAELLHEENSVNQIVIYDNLSRENYGFFFRSEKLPKIRFVKGDILDNHKLEQELRSVDIVIHLAGHVAFPYNHLQNLQYEQINRWGTLSVVRAVENAGRVKQFFYLSSLAVYGFGKNMKFEDEPTPGNAYGVSKYEAEKYVLLLKKKCRVNIMRSGNVFGFNRMVRLDSVMNSFFFEACVKGNMKIYGNGNQLRTFVHINKLTRQMVDTLLNADSPTFTYAADFSASLNEIKDILVEQQPGSEYTYINQNQSFDDQQFEIPSARENIKQEVTAAYTDFKSKFIL